MKTIAAVIFIFLCFFQSVALANITYDKLSEIDKAYYKGDDIKLVEELVKHVKKYPYDPASVLHLYDLYSMKNISGDKVFLETAEYLLNTIKKSRNLSIKQKNSFWLQVLKMKAEIYSQKRDPENIVMYKKYSPLKKWSLSESYQKYGAADLDHSFVNENNYKDLPHRINLKNIEGFLNFKDFVFPSTGIVYAATRFDIREECNIRIESNANYKLLVNGKVLLENNIKKIYRNKRIITVKNTGKIFLLLKCRVSKDSWFRVVITDKKNIPIKAFSKKNTDYIKKINYKESFDYPVKVLRSKKNVEEQKLFTRARYFSVLDSNESIDAYQRLNLLSKNPVYLELYAKELLHHSISRHSKKYLTAWRIIKKLWENYPDFIPAKYHKLKNIRDYENKLNAIKYAEKILLKAPKFVLINRRLIDLYKESFFETNFLKLTSLYKMKFKHDDYADIALGHFYYNKNSELAYQYCSKILKKKKFWPLQDQAATILVNQGNYQKALKILKLDIDEDSFEQKIKIIETLINAKQYKKAKQLLFSLISQKKDPLVYYYLGVIDKIQNRDAELYWNKLSKTYPWFEFPKKYLLYKKHGKFVSEFDVYRNKKHVRDIIGNVFNNPFYRHYNILHRAHYYRIYEKGYTELFCEELIHIKDEEDLQNYGEYKIPYYQNPEIVEAIVYHPSGEKSTAYQAQQAGGSTYISLNNLKINSLVHVKYKIKNPFSRLKGSRFIYSGQVFMQKYNESIANCEVKIITKDKKLNLFNSQKIKKTIRKKDHLYIYSIQKKHIKPVMREKYNIDAWNNLFAYSITNLTSDKEFYIWYRYNWPLPKKIKIKSLENISKNKNIIELIYNFVAHEIDLSEYNNYTARDIEDTIFLKRASVEDKVFLAKILLEQSGIKAYPALIRKDSFNKKNSIISPANIKNILLYIPLSKTSEIWLDFSSQYIPYGAISADYINKNSEVVLTNQSVIKKVKAKLQDSIDTDYKIYIKENGFANLQLKTSFKGTKSKIRSFFKDKRYAEDNISFFYNRFLREELVLNSFKYSNYNNYDDDFSLSIDAMIPGFSKVGEKSLAFAPFLKDSLLIKYIRSKERRSPLVIKSAYNTRDVYEYTVLPKFINSEYSFVKKIKFMKNYAEYIIRKKKGSSKVVVSQIVKFSAITIPGEKYKKFLQFCLQMRKIEHMRVVLK